MSNGHVSAGRGAHPHFLGNIKLVFVVVLKISQPFNYIGGGLGDILSPPRKNHNDDECVLSTYCTALGD